MLFISVIWKIHLSGLIIFFREPRCQDKRGYTVRDKACHYFTEEPLELPVTDTDLLRKMLDISYVIV